MKRGCRHIECVLPEKLAASILEFADITSHLINSQISCRLKSEHRNDATLSRRFILKNQFQRHDDLPVVSEAGCYARDWLAVAPGEWRCEYVVCSAIYVQIGMIEQVVEFGPELQFQPLLRQRDILEQGRVLVVRSGLAECVAGQNTIERPVHRNLASEGRARRSEGKESKLSYSGNLLVENRNGLIVDAEVFVANGTAERDAALMMLEKISGTQPVTVGGDKGFDTFGFVAECRNLQVVRHVAQNLGRRGGSAIDGRTTRYSGYAISQKKRKRIEECFGWLKTIALMRKLRHRGVCKVDWIFSLACAAYNLVCAIWRPQFRRCKSAPKCSPI